MEAKQKVDETGVNHSLMPKGVEHKEVPDITQRRPVVNHSLMPKGVEHKSLRRQLASLS